MQKSSARNFRHVLANGDSIESLKINGSGMTALSSNGEINAHDKQELMQSISTIMSLASQGEIKQESVTSAEQKAAEAEMVAQANSSVEDWAALGAAIAEEIQEQSERRGFLRNVAVGNTLRQGEYQRVPMPRHEV